MAVYEWNVTVSYLVITNKKEKKHGVWKLPACEFVLEASVWTRRQRGAGIPAPASESGVGSGLHLALSACPAVLRPVCWYNETVTDEEMDCAARKDSQALGSSRVRSLGFSETLLCGSSILKKCHLHLSIPSPSCCPCSEHFWVHSAVLLRFVLYLGTICCNPCYSRRGNHITISLW